MRLPVRSPCSRTREIRAARPSAQRHPEPRRRGEIDLRDRDLGDVHLRDRDLGDLDLGDVAPSGPRPWGPRPWGPRPSGTSTFGDRRPWRGHLRPRGPRGSERSEPGPPERAGALGSVGVGSGPTCAATTSPCTAAIAKIANTSWDPPPALCPPAQERQRCPPVSATPDLYPVLAKKPPPLVHPWSKLGAGEPRARGPVTTRSLPLHRAITGRRRDRPTLNLEMENTGRLLFVALVTCYLLGRIFGPAANPVEVVVYGMTAAFGLEYLVASWGGLWQRG